MKWLGKAILILFIAIIARDGLAQDKANQGVLSEDTSLIVELMVGRDATGENIEIYQHEGGFLVPLGYLTGFIDFAIEVNVNEGQAYGWFIKENRNFLLDTNKRIIVIEGKEKPLDSRMIIAGTDDIYVDSSLFSEWFPIDLELDFSRLILKLKPREKLPFQERLERNKYHSKLSRAEKKQNNYQKIITEPANFTIPVLNIDVGNQFDSQSDRQNIASYSILAQGDAAKLSTNLYLSGDSDESMTSMRIKAGNKDRNGDMLGFMKATEYAVGDINSVSVPLVSGSGRGRGFYISNFDLTRPEQFDQTNFVGDSQPGWEVEIYRNGELLGFQVIGDDGRYEFKNIPVLYGNNNFKIVSYGPQGQVQEEIKNYSIDDSILQKGKFNYRVSGDEKSQSVFGVDEQNTVFQHKKETRFIGDIEYGLTDRITASTGIITTPLEDNKTHNYQTLGLKGSVGGVLAAFNVAYDYENQGSAEQVVVNTSIKDISTRLEHKQYNNFISEEEALTADLRESTSQIDLNGRISAVIPAGLSYGLGAKQEIFANERSITTYSNRLATSIYAIGFGNDLQAVETKTGDLTTNFTTGTFSIRGSYHEVFIRLSSDYNIAPISQMQSVNLSLQKDLDNNLTLRSNIKKDLGASDLTTVNLGITKEFGSYRLSAITSADTNDNYTIGVRMSFSIGKDSNNNKWFATNRDVASSGAISASAFIDNNYNGIYDADDAMVENAEFKIGNRSYGQKDGDNVALITGLEPFMPVDLSVNSASLEDPFLTPEVKGYNVMTRPGVITPIIFPVAYTTEIDGTVFDERSGASKPLSRVTVELVDSEGKIISTTQSEYDGFYILSGVTPGDFHIRLAKESVEHLHLDSSPKVAIKIPPKSDFVSGMDIIVGGEEK